MERNKKLTNSDFLRDLVRCCFKSLSLFFKNEIPKSICYPLSGKIFFNVSWKHTKNYSSCKFNVHFFTVSFEVFWDYDGLLRGRRAFCRPPAAARLYGVFFSSSSYFNMLLSTRAAKLVGHGRHHGDHRRRRGDCGHGAGYACRHCSLPPPYVG